MHSSGFVLKNDFDSDIGLTGPDSFVEFLRERLTGESSSDYSGPDVGWTQSGRIKAQFTFSCEAFINGDHIDVQDKNGNLVGIFKVYDPNIPGSTGNVIYNPDRFVLLATLGSVAQELFGWTFVIITDQLVPAIKFGNIVDNMMTLSITPTGTAGFFDFNPAHITGQGKTWGAGWQVESQIVTPSATQLTLNITTSNKPDPGITIAPVDSLSSIVSFDLLPGIWTFLANKYQMFLVRPGVTNEPSFFLCSHLYPSYGLTFCNVIAGSIYGQGGLNGGKRRNFNEVLNLFYINTGSPFTSSELLTVSVPVWGNGITSIDKSGQPLFGLPVRNDIGNYAVFDAFIAGPRFAEDSTSFILGWLWDSLIYSNYLVSDTSSTLNSKSAYVMISQVGNDPFTSNSPGSLVVQDEN